MKDLSSNQKNNNNMFLKKKNSIKDDWVLSKGLRSQLEEILLEYLHLLPLMINESKH